MSESLRAVVIGASGIGKHHVKWLMRAGCDVVGFAGTSPESVASTYSSLKDTLGFSGVGYTSVSAMLGECRPHLASVASPMGLHFDHVSACLAAGAHVLCEKPLVGYPDLSAECQLFLAERMVRTAEGLGLILATNTQYAAAAQHLRTITGVSGQIGEFFMQMESRGQGRERTNEEIWQDLAAHPISVLLALVPDGRVDWATVRYDRQPRSNDCRFDFVSPDGSVCKARILVRHVPEGPLARRFTVNGVTVSYEGRDDESGVYCAYLKADGLELKARDFMEESITRFAEAIWGRGEVLVSGAVGLRNLEMQLRLPAGTS